MITSKTKYSTNVLFEKDRLSHMKTAGLGTSLRSQKCFRHVQPYYENFKSRLLSALLNCYVYFAVISLLE